MQRATAGAVVVLLTVMLAACGRETNHDVRVSIEQLASIASEGALMGDDVARDRTKITFVRVHGEELSSQAEHEAEKLNDAPVAPSLHARVQAAIKLSSDISGAIDDLRVSPQDREQARSSARDLRKLSSRARNLAGSP